MANDRDNIRSLYEHVIEEKITPLAVAGGDGTKPGDLPGETTAVNTGTGTESSTTKEVETPDEPSDLSTTKKEKGTKVTAKKKSVTAIKDSVEPRKSFMDLFDQVMVKEEGEIDGIEDVPQDDWEENGDVPPQEEEPADNEMSEGEIYSQLSDLFGKLAEVKGGELDAGIEDEIGPEDDMEDVPAAESTIAEMKYEPEPRELHANTKERQLPTSLAGKGVKTSAKKSVYKGGDKKRTGELETAPEGMKHDKSKYAVKGDGPAHKAGNASALED